MHYNSFQYKPNKIVHYPSSGETIELNNRYYLDGIATSSTSWFKLKHSETNKR